MATVYLAIQENFQREVALKVMSPALSADSNFSERFLREARIVSHLVHPHIVTVHDVGIENGHHYLSMEYVEGRDLKESLPDLTGEQLFRVIKDVAMALDYAGGKGYVHRDVKPENIMIHNSDGRAVLMDFGIARASDADNSMTRTGTALGTPHYMSPEQARGEVVDGRSDLYSLGVLLYYMLTGHVPYEADSPVAVGIKHVSAALPKLPPKLSSYQFLIDKLMAKKPQDRYENGQELVAVLQQLDVSFVDQYRSQDDFAYSTSQQDTPLRNETVKVTRETENPVAVPDKKPIADFSAPQPQESLHIPEEDLDGRLEQSSSSPWLLIILVVMLSGGATYYFFQQEIHQVALAFIDKQEVAPVKAAIIEESVRPSNIEEKASEKLAEVSPLEDRQIAGLAADNNVQGETLESVVPIAIDPIEELLAQAELLNNQLEKVPEKVDLYRQVLSIEPDEKTAIAGLKAIKDKRLLSVKENIDEGALDVAEQSLDTTVALFPDIVEAESYQQVVDRLAVEREKLSLLAQASEYLDNDRLINPEVTNAKETYDKVLAIDPGNSEAQQGLQKIAERYLVLAQASRSKRDYRKAISMVDNGLSVKSEDLALLALKEKLQAELKLEQDIQALLALGDQLAQQQKWFASDQDAAVKKYLQVLSMQPGRTEAKTKISTAVGEFVEDINGLIAIKDYDVASAQVALALMLLPENKQLQSTVLVLESLKPAIDSLVLSGNPIVDTGAVMPAAIKADRTLHLSFRYKNLLAPTTVLQAVLFDGGRSVQIAGVPVVVVGEQGYTQFRIDRPVEGFADGGYHIDILLAGERIFTYAFVISQ